MSRVVESRTSLYVDRNGWIWQPANGAHQWHSGYPFRRKDRYREWDDLVAANDNGRWLSRFIAHYDNTDAILQFAPINVTWRDDT